MAYLYNLNNLLKWLNRYAELLNNLISHTDSLRRDAQRWSATTNLYRLSRLASNSTVVFLQDISMFCPSYWKEKVVNNLRIYMPITTFYPLIGGTEKQALIKGQSLIERGYQVTIITFRHDRTWLKHEMVEGVPVMRIAGTLVGNRQKLPRLLQRLLYGVALLMMGWTLWRHRRNYDLLQVYQLTLLALPVALVCRLTGKPMLIVA